MARICQQCNRPLTPEHHDIGDKPRIIIARGRIHRARVYGCRVRLVATNPATGETFVPDSPQRIKVLNQRYVHESRFDLDLKPGGTDA